MSRRHLQSIVAWICVILGAIVAGYAILEFTHPKIAAILDTLFPLLVAIPAAYLAASFSRRNSHLQALRDLWGQLIPAAQTAIQYTHLEQPTQTQYARTLEALATAIDMLRGVFDNVATDRPPGLYPYENLKDIYKVIQWLGCGSGFRGTQDAKKARKCVTRLWQEMHSAMLTEFDRAVPMRPVSKYLANGYSVADLLFDNKLEDAHLALGQRASRPLLQGE